MGWGDDHVNHVHTRAPSRYGARRLRSKGYRLASSLVLASRIGEKYVPVLCGLGVRRIASEQPGQCVVPNDIAGIKRGMRSPAL
eukprot:1180114-Prorocentrum_minimum.AAC.8